MRPPLPILLRTADLLLVDLQRVAVGHLKLERTRKSASSYPNRRVRRLLPSFTTE